ncbi:kinase-like domain-containing protein [Aspergillus cavernicola]|uniref:Serine/threonine-protein kinase ATG1 n=1 Tax=Aspergillus cavernicola TaxID=176166 RepID=A0ABR4HU75_9EURO
MEPFLSTSLVDWRLDTRFDVNGDRYHTGSYGPECWRPLKRLGNGTFGDVWQEHRVFSANQNTFRAVKQIRRLQAGFLTISKRELEALVTFSNPDVPEYQDHFVQFLGWFDDEHHLYIAMEYMHFGDLQQYITFRSFPESEAASIASQVAQGLHYMHESSFVHRDIKPLNILVSEPGPRWHVKLADFGLAKSMDGTILATQFIGTRGYMAPELIEESATEYTPAVDLWALGAVVFCMRTRVPPFPSTRHLIDYVYHQKIEHITKPLGMSSGYCVDFVLGTMAAEAPSRLTIQQVLAHDWLSMQSGVEHHGYTAESTMATNPWDQIGSNAWSSTISNESSREGTPNRGSNRHPQAMGSAPQPRSGGLPPYNTMRSQSEQTVTPASQVSALHATSATLSAAGWPRASGGSQGSEYKAQQERASIAKQEAVEKRDRELRERLVLEFGYTEEEVEDILNKKNKKGKKDKDDKRGNSDSLSADGPAYPGRSYPNQLQTALPLRTSSKPASNAQNTPHTDAATTAPVGGSPVPSASSSRHQLKNPESTLQEIPTWEEKGEATPSLSAEKTSIKDNEPPASYSGSNHEIAQEDVSKHKASSDTDQDPFLTCVTCKESFHFRSDLLKHLKKQQHARDLVTKEGRYYKRSEAPRTPQNKQLLLRCNLCNETFDCSHCFANHRKDSGHGQNTDDPLVTCRTCHESFECHDDLLGHLRGFGHARSSKDSLRTCRICNKGFNCFNCLSNHLNSSGHGQE